MVVTLESIQKNKEIYNKAIEDTKKKLSELIKKKMALGMQKRQNTSDMNIALCDFEEAKLMQEIKELDFLLKKNKLTLEIMKVQEKALLGEIDNITFSNSSIAIKKEIEELSNQDQLAYYENEINKCDKAIALFTLMGNDDEVNNWQEKLKKEKQELRYVKKDMGLEQEPTEPITKKEKEEKKEEKKQETKKENGIDVTITEDEEKTKTVKSMNGVEICRDVQYKDGSSEQTSRNIIKDGEKDDFGRTITLSENYCNFTAHQAKYDNATKTHTEKWTNPLIDNMGKVIGQKKATEVINLEGGQTNINIREELEGYNGTFNIETLIEGIGSQYKEQRNMTVENKISGSIEKVQYTKDEQGKETYTYIENGILCEKITKTNRGTTIEIYKDGQIYDTYEYDENGKALIPMGEMQELPENYVESAFSNVIPEHDMIVHKEPEEILSQKDSSKEQAQDFRASMKFKMPEGAYEDILKRHQDAKQDEEERFYEDIYNEQSGYGLG